MIKGIAFPIAFNCNYRGKRYKEINLYFSFIPLDRNEIDFINPDDTKDRDVELLKNKLYQKYHYLVPYKIENTEGYEAPLGKRFSIGLLDQNPTTATLFNRIALMPCADINLTPMLQMTNYPDFYIGLKQDRYYLYIKTDDNQYQKIPAQDISVACWHEYAHPHITYHGERSPDSYDDIDWRKIIKDLRTSEYEYIRTNYEI